MAMQCCSAVLFALGLLAVASAQQTGSVSEEALPALVLQNCSEKAGCVPVAANVTLDANWRWVHAVNGSQNCFTGASWDTQLCPDPETCTKTCAIEGVDLAGYEKTYGIRSTDVGLDMAFIAEGGNVGSRVYVTESNESQITYKLFKLKNREFTFDVDVSKLPCGVNGALYFVEMPADGGKGNTTSAGAKYGTGYCDAQCPHDVKWIDGEANSQGWQSSSGHYGSCCAEFDIWEANSMAAAFTAHPCNLTSALRCEGETCGDTSTGNRYTGVCDKDGCDWNSFRMGDVSFYGPGLKVDTTKPFTVVTQFITKNGTDQAPLSEIRRLYVQDGKVIPNSQANVQGAAMVKGNSITDAFCQAQKEAFSEANDFAAKEGLEQMGESLERGMVLVLSVWDDSATGMTWLDSAWPPAKNSNDAGVMRGPCKPDSGSSAYVRSAFPKSRVQYSNIRFGEIGSTVHIHGRQLADVHV